MMVKKLAIICIYVCMFVHICAVCNELNNFKAPHLGQVESFSPVKVKSYKYKS